MSKENVLKFPPNVGKPVPPEAPSRWSKLWSRGRANSQWIIGGVAIAAGTAIYSYQTIGIQYYIDLIRSYRHGTPLQVPDEIQCLINTASTKLKLTSQEAGNLKSFMVSGFDIKSFGSVYSSHSGWIGIPLNYLYDSRADIDRMNIKLRTDAIRWDSEAGGKLEQSLLLTEDEKLFGILRTALELRNYNYIHSAVLPAITVFGVYSTAPIVYKKYNIFQTALFGRGLVYVLASVFAFGVYTFITDTVRNSHVTAIDKELISLGADVVEAGIRFYEKVLQKNIALRELSGQDWYSVKGNEYTGLFRFTDIPLTSRKRELEEALKKIREQEATESNVEAPKERSNTK